MSYPIETLIDPQAQVIDRTSSTRALKFIHRALLSHLYTLTQAKKVLSKKFIEREDFTTEFNSTCQLSEDLGNYLKTRTDG
jgi:hypothetical protein